LEVSWTYFWVWGRASVILIWTWADSGKAITFAAASHLATCREGVPWCLLLISCSHKPGYVHHILQNANSHHLVQIVCTEEMLSFVITAITTIGQKLGHWGIMSCIYTRATKQTMIKAECPDTINRWVLQLAVCTGNNHPTLLGW
jgi:hypothetical protein